MLRGAKIRICPSTEQPALFGRSLARSDSLRDDRSRNASEDR
jgi:hypothetical protein